MQKTAVEDLVSEIRSGGVQALRDIVDRRESEKYFVDFKRTEEEDYSDKKSLPHSDRKNLEKAISGFGNSEGGVLIWGIENKSGEDFPVALKPFKGKERFRGLLSDCIGKATIPPHSSAENFVVEDASDGEKGYVVSVIPKTEGLPIQVINSGRFYMRSGDSFVNLPYGVLSGMFGRRPNPNVTVMFTFVNGEGLALKNGYVSFQIGIQLGNMGKGIARDVFLNAEYFMPGKESQIWTQFPDKKFEGYNVFGVQSNIMSTSDFRMGPGQRVQPLVFKIELKPPFTRDFVFKLVSGADGQIPNSGKLRKTPKELEELYETIRDGKATNETLETFFAWEMTQI